jgi:DNA-binding NarL/FixJ family response regulator
VKVTRLETTCFGGEGENGNGGPGAAIKVLIADHPATRLGIRMALGAEVRICAEADDVESAIRRAKYTQPDVAFVGRDCLSDWRVAVRGVCRAAPDCAVVVLASSEDPEDMLESVRAGAVGYVPGSLDATHLMRVFRAAADHEAIVPQSMMMDLLEELRGGRESSDALTRREAQILGMLRRDHSTAWIAERLQITPVTVRRHISELVRKLGAESRSDLLAQRTG